MQIKDLFIRCYAEKQGELWVAVCIDLSLAVQADSLIEASTKLDAQIRDYVTEALSEPQYAAQLLKSRKAPIQQVLRYHWIRAAIKLHVIKESIAKSFDRLLPLTIDTHKPA